MNQTFIRDRDKKVFKVVYLSHWSDIKAEDGEVDRVKWYGPAFVSALKGETYRHSDSCTCCEVDPIL